MALVFLIITKVRTYSAFTQSLQINDAINVVSGTVQIVRENSLLIALPSANPKSPKK